MQTLYISTNIAYKLCSFFLATETQNTPKMLVDCFILMLLTFTFIYVWNHQSPALMFLLHLLMSWCHSNLVSSEFLTLLLIDQSPNPAAPFLYWHTLTSLQHLVLLTTFQTLLSFSCSEIVQAHSCLSLLFLPPCPALMGCLSLSLLQHFIFLCLWIIQFILRDEEVNASPQTLFCCSQLNS